MAITSFGYGVDSTNTEGEIGVLQWALMSRYMGAQYAVGDGGLSVTIPPTGDRALTMAAGEAYTHGVLSISDAATALSLAAPSSGTRWYIVGMKFEWNATPDPVTTIPAGGLGYGSTIAAALATLTVNPGVRVDMPLYAARVVAGQAKVQELVDLRLFGSGSTFSANSAEVMNFADRLGTTINIAFRQFVRVAVGPGAPEWLEINRINLDQLVNIGWGSSTLDSAGLELERNYRIKNGWAVFQANGRATANLTNVDRTILTFANEAYHPGRTAYGTAWVGSNSNRAYVTTGGEVHINPLTIANNNTIQVYITWPV